MHTINEKILNQEILNKLSHEFKNYKIRKIAGGASKKIIYRIFNDNHSFIVIDYNLDIKDYNAHIKIYNILKKIDISIPKIIEINENNLLIITEDFGNLRFDKILKDKPIKKLLHYAVDTLIVLKKSINYNNDKLLPKYNFEIFKEEIMELPNYYFPFININNININEEFMSIWTEAYINTKFKFETFIHKDFNINNLLLLPSKKNHLKCGVIDYQSAFWGESSWDLFSLLEDSRIYFKTDYSDYFIKYYFSNIILDTSLEEFKFNFHFLNLSRQTRLLGRWIKLSKDFNQTWYLDFIPITKKRLAKSLTYINNNKLIMFYEKHILNL